MIFEKVSFYKAETPDKIMIAMKEAGKRVWYHATQQSYADAKQLKENDDVEIKLAESQKEGMKVINFIKKTGQDKPQPNQFKCIDCGKILKDDKYSKCFTCNQKNPEKKDFDVDLSKRQTIAHAVSRSLIALQGQVDLDTVGDVIDKLWIKFSELLQKN